MGIKAALALTVAGEQEIVGIFRTKRAVTMATARSLRELGLNDSKALHNMVIATIIRRVGPDRYFLDEPTWAGRRQLGAGTMVRLLVVGGVILAALIIYFNGR